MTEIKLNADFTLQETRREKCSIEGLKKDRNGQTWGLKEVQDPQSGEKRTLKWCVLELHPVDTMGAGDLDGDVVNNIIKPVMNTDTPRLYNTLREIYDDKENGGEVALHGKTLTVEIQTINLNTPCKVLLTDKDGKKYVSKHPKTGRPNLRWSIDVVRFLNEKNTMHKLVHNALRTIAEESEFGGGFVYDSNEVSSVSGESTQSSNPEDKENARDLDIV